VVVNATPPKNGNTKYFTPDHKNYCYIEEALRVIRLVWPITLKMIVKKCGTYLLQAQPVF
ncbi:hypothetical protein NL477_27740, partial [Klebsiella pneumoniae]|nr:hypothetical protein [Klebsiella pneumoniae]